MDSLNGILIYGLLSNNLICAMSGLGLQIEIEVIPEIDAEALVGRGGMYSPIQDKDDTPKSVKIILRYNKMEHISNHQISDNNIKVVMKIVKIYNEMLNKIDKMIVKFKDVKSV